MFYLTLKTGTVITEISIVATIFFTPGKNKLNLPVQKNSQL